MSRLPHALQRLLTCGHGFLQVYDIPHLHVEGKLCRTNLAPRTIMRGPGFLNAVMVAEQVTACRSHITPHFVHFGCKLSRSQNV